MVETDDVSVKIGFLFPGQGAQYVGMGQDWAGRFAEAKRIYEEADKLLGFSICQLCFDGPEEKLTQTLYAQPAIFVTSLAILAVIQGKVPDLFPDFVAGLSLGEFTALTASQSLSFSEGLKLVQTRAELMEKAASETQGSMVSILGLNQQKCETIAKESGVQFANLNAPVQFVLSGETQAVAHAARLAESRGAKRAIRLKVGGAFHSPLMDSAKKGLQRMLKQVSILAPKAFFVANASAEPETHPERIRTLLGEQLTSSVRWIETMERARSLGVCHFIEIGPGRILKGLAKRIDPTLEVVSLEKVSDLEPLLQTLEKLKGHPTNEASFGR